MVSRYWLYSHPRGSFRSKPTNPLPCHAISVPLLLTWHRKPFCHFWGQEASNSSFRCVKYGLSSFHSLESLSFGNSKARSSTLSSANTSVSWDNLSQNNLAWWLAATTSARNLLQVQILGSYLRPTEWETLGVGLSNILIALQAILTQAITWKQLLSWWQHGEVGWVQKQPRRNWKY